MELGESRDRPSTAGSGAWVELSEVSGGQPSMSAREEAWNKQQVRYGKGGNIVLFIILVPKVLQ